MKKYFGLASLFILGMLAVSGQDASFSDYFTGSTMRVDYFHSGTSTEEHFSPDRILNDGPWPGSKTFLTDDLNLGPYFFEIKDPVSSKVLYSRGFGSIFGEWQTIGETGWATIHESVRFPWPKNPVHLVIHKRDEKNKFVPVWELSIDPASRTVNPAILNSGYRVWTCLENGPAEQKVDIVVLGDGYTTAEMEKYHKDVKRLTDCLFNYEPFLSRKSDFNIRAVETPSAESGVNKPHPGVFHRTPLSVSYGAFDSERYVLAFDNKVIRDAASSVPYDFMIIIVNEQTYGGGGIHQLYATVSADNKFAEYIVVHEFGHHFASLGDEYYTSAVSYEVTPVLVEPWEPNVTALLNPGNLKWKHLVNAGTPIPTPWNKEEFDNYSFQVQQERKKIRADKLPESVMEDLFEREKTHERGMIAKEKYKDQTGAFEGCSYHQYGLFRPAIDCIMYTRNMTGFCPVCRETIGKVIDRYTK